MGLYVNKGKACIKAQEKKENGSNLIYWFKRKRGINGGVQ
jgi:hypothetical protein